MKQRSHVVFYTLLLVIPCLFAVVAMIQRDRTYRLTRVSIRTADIIPAFKTDDVSEIEIDWRDLSTKLHKQNGRWVVSNRANLPADPKRIQALLEELRTLKPLKLISPVTQETMTRLRVSPETKDPKQIPGVHCILKNKQSEPILELVLGRGHFVELPDESAQQAQRPPDGRYLLLIRKNRPSIIFLTASVFEDYHPLPGTWLQSPELERLPETMRLEFRQIPHVNPVWMIFRPTLTSGFQTFGPSSNRVSIEAVRTIFGILSKHYISDALPKDQYKNVEQPFASLTLESKEGVKRTLRFRRIRGDARRILFSVEAVSPEGKQKSEKADALARGFTDGRENIYYEIPAQLFDLLKTPPFEQKKQK